MLNTLNRVGLTLGTLGTAAGITLFTTNLQVKIASIRINITTTATAGNRNLVLVGKDSISALWRTMSTTAQVAGTQYLINAAAGYPNQVTTTIILMPLSNSAYLLPGGSLVLSDLANIDVLDNVTDGNILFEY